MRFYREAAFTTERELEAVCTLPMVLDFDQLDGDHDVTFRTAPYPQPPGSHVKPIWHHGESLAAALAAERELNRRAKEAASDEMRLRAEAAKLNGEEEAKRLTDALLTKEREHLERLANVQGGAQVKIGDLDARVAELEATVTLARRDGETALRNLARAALDQGKYALSEAVLSAEGGAIDMLYARISQAHEALVRVQNEPGPAGGIVAAGVPADKAAYVTQALELSSHATGVTLSAMTVMHSLDTTSGERLKRLGVEVATSAAAMLDALITRLVTGVSPDGTRAAALDAALRGLASFVQVLTGKADLPPEVQTTVESVLSALKAALLEVARLQHETAHASGSKPEDRKRKELHVRIVEGAHGLLVQLQGMLGAALQLQDDLFVPMNEGRPTSDTEAALMHLKWVRGIEIAVNQIQTDLPHWLETMRHVLHAQTHFTECEALTRTLAAMTAQLLADVRTKPAVAGSDAPARVARHANALISASRQVGSAINEAYNLASGTGPFDSSKLSDTERKAMVVDTQAQIIALEKSLDTAKGRLGSLRREPYNTEAAKKESAN
jgi:hypothetical protein